MAIECSTKVEQSPRHCKFEGLSPIGPINRKEKEEKKDKALLILGSFSLV